MCNKEPGIAWKTARAAALKLCKGSYQHDLIMGHQALSGADLRGMAQKYAAGYARSRRAIQIAMCEAGIPFNVGVGEHGTTFLVFGDWATLKIENIKDAKKALDRRQRELYSAWMFITNGTKEEREDGQKHARAFARDASAVRGNLARMAEYVQKMARLGRITPSVTRIVDKCVHNALAFVQWDRDNFAV